MTTRLTDSQVDAQLSLLLPFLNYFRPFATITSQTPTPTTHFLYHSTPTGQGLRRAVGPGDASHICTRQFISKIGSRRAI